jgi:hypothetical protein
LIGQIRSGLNVRKLAAADEATVVQARSKVNPKKVGRQIRR